MIDRNYTRRVFREQEPHWGGGLLGWAQRRNGQIMTEMEMIPITCPSNPGPNGGDAIQ